MKFRLLAGSHCEKGIIYDAKNPIVDSVNPLDIVFPGRFAKISVNPVSTAPDEKTTVKSDSIQPKESIKETIKETVKVQAEKAASEVPKLIADKGTLVDGDFEFDPEVTGLHVFKKDKMFFVYDADNMSKSLNKKPLPRSKVLKYINSQLEE